MTDDRPLYHRRLHDWEFVDEINVRIVPRYKTSGMSGDEWRQHVQVDFKLKGEVVGGAGFRDIDAMLIGIGGAYHALGDSGIPDEALKVDDASCDQPSCRNAAVGRFEIKRLTSERGEYLDPEEQKYARYFRKFCRVHLRRGDCSREDCDDNYIPLDGVSADESTNVQSSPSGQIVVNVQDGEL